MNDVTSQIPSAFDEPSANHREPMQRPSARVGLAKRGGVGLPEEISVTVYFLGSLTMRVQRELVQLRISAGTPVDWLLEMVAVELPGFGPVLEEPDGFVVFADGLEAQRLDLIEEDAQIILMPAAATLRGVSRSLYHANPCTVLLAPTH